MEFREVKRSETKTNGELISVMSEFLKSGIEVAELVGWEDTYATSEGAYYAAKRVSKGYFPNLKVTKLKDKIFMERV